jgi:voltage-gated potassium channel
VSGLRDTLAGLYQGHDARARRFRYGLLAFDFASLAYFVASSFVEHTGPIIALDAAIAALIALDLAARFIISRQRAQFFLQLTTWLDAVVILSLLSSAVLESFLFLRILRALRMLRSYHVLADLRASSRFAARNEDVIESVINLVVFVFVMTALVYVLQARVNENIENYVDALYFTVTALTTTGFGDITLSGASGRVLAILIMVFGVALFLRLVQTIFRPSKIHHECPDCGLTRHEADAVHCKHCGRVLHIESEGDG